MKTGDRERGREDGGQAALFTVLRSAHRPFLAHFFRFSSLHFRSFFPHIWSCYLVLSSFVFSLSSTLLFSPSVFFLWPIPCMARRVACVPHFPKCAAILAPHSSLAARLAACVACSCRLFGKANANSHQAVLGKPVLSLFYDGLLFSQLKLCKVQSKSKQLVSSSMGRYLTCGSPFAALLARSFPGNTELQEGNKQQKHRPGRSPTLSFPEPSKQGTQALIPPSVPYWVRGLP